MKESYWNLFWLTGVPAFYLLRKQEEELRREEQERRTR